MSEAQDKIKAKINELSKIEDYLDEIYIWIPSASRVEINRIVEITIETLEKDIFSILSDSGYENAYYGF